MRILFLTSAFEGVAGYWRAFNLGKHLAARGNQVCLICQGKEPSFKATSKNVEGVQVYLLPTLVSSSKNLLVETAARVSTLLMQTGFNILHGVNSGYDVVHVFDAAFPQNGIPTLLGLNGGNSSGERPLVFVDWDDWMGRGGSLNLFYGEGAYGAVIPFLSILEERTPRHAVAVTVTTQMLRKRALEVGIGAEDLVMLPNGTNTDSIKPLAMSEARKQLDLQEDALIYTCNKSEFSSSLGPGDPMLDLFIAHKSVLKSFPNANLLLVGKGSHECRAWTKSLGIDDNVLSAERQTLSKLALFFSASNFLILPIRDTLFDRARFPLRLADYMAAGRPIVATDLPEIRRIAEDCSFLANPGDPDDLADKMRQALSTPSKSLERMSRIAREKAVKQYSWAKISEQLEKVYQSCIERT